MVGRDIYLVELPAPKEGSFYEQGLEHIEFVIKDSFAEFMHKHSTVEFNTIGVSKPINPDIAIKYDSVTVKFHHHSLEYIIQHEKKTSN